MICTSVKSGRFASSIDQIFPAEVLVPRLSQLATNLVANSRHLSDMLAEALIFDIRSVIGALFDECERLSTSCLIVRRVFDGFLDDTT